MMTRGMGWGWLIVFVSCVVFVVGSNESYGVVVDLGSKGSRVAVFVWPTDAKNPYTKVEFGGGNNPWYSKINPGVASFASNPRGAGPYLKPLLDYAESNIPSSQLSTTPIFIRGTDNLRRLPPSAADAILESIYDYTQNHYNFLMTSGCISLISGQEEGGFLWVTANYLQGTFADSDDPIGTLDMGSGSTQIVYIPKSGTYLPPNYTYGFDYKRDTYEPYVHSYGGFGYLAAIYALNNTLTRQTTASVVDNPCLLNGYSSSYVADDRYVTIQGSGSWSQCNDLMQAFLNISAYCSYPPCRFDGAFQPPLNGKFLAVSNYADVAEVLGYDDKATVQDIIDGGIEFCSLSWSEAQRKYPDVDPQDLYSVCFGANYISNLLSKGYGFDLDTKISFGKKYNKAPYSWTLGAMVYELQKGWHVGLKL